MTHAFTPEELPAVFARLTMREDEERQARKLYRAMLQLGTLATGPLNRTWDADENKG